MCTYCEAFQWINIHFHHLRNQNKFSILDSHFLLHKLMCGFYYNRRVDLAWDVVGYYIGGLMCIPSSIQSFAIYFGILIFIHIIRQMWCAIWSFEASTRENWSIFNIIRLLLYFFIFFFCGYSQIAIIYLRLERFFTVAGNNEGNIKKKINTTLVVNAQTSFGY